MYKVEKHFSFSLAKMEGNFHFANKNVKFRHYRVGLVFAVTALSLQFTVKTTYKLRHRIITSFARSRAATGLPLNTKHVKECREIQNLQQRARQTLAPKSVDICFI